MFQILQGNAKSVMWEPRHMTTARKIRGETPGSVPKISSGLQAHAARMHDDQYLKSVYPIATGVIEGAYRHLLKNRMERSGIRRTFVSATAALHLHAGIASQGSRTNSSHRRVTELEPPLDELLRGTDRFSRSETTCGSSVPYGCGTIAHFRKEKQRYLSTQPGRADYEVLLSQSTELPLRIELT